MKTIRTKAIILQRTNYGEADRILKLLTPDGMVSVIARGVRREKSKLAGGIELFARCDVTLYQGKGELLVLTGARLEQFYGSILSDYYRLLFAYEVLKQVAKAASMLDEEAFFTLLDQSLAELDDKRISLPIIKAWFWLQLAILSGVGMNLSSDDTGAKLDGSMRYDFDQTQAVLRRSERGRFSADHIKLLRLLSAYAPHVAMQVNGVDALIDDCLWLAEQAVTH